EAQIEHRMQSGQYRRLLPEAEAVGERFARDSTGYTLSANMRPHSLELQPERWQSSSGAARVAQALHEAVQDVAPKLFYRNCQRPRCGQQLASFLAQWQPPHAAPLAAPGLSSHG